MQSAHEPSPWSGSSPVDGSAVPGYPSDRRNAGTSFYNHRNKPKVLFWQDNFDIIVYPIWPPSPRTEVLTYSNASDCGWTGFAVQIREQVEVGSWSKKEGCKSSSQGTEKCKTSNRVFFPPS